PARLLVGRAGTSYRTATLLELRADHAMAVDAVWAELDIERDLGRELVERYRILGLATLAPDKTSFLQQPGLGRQLTPESKSVLARDGIAGCDLQIALGDGLSPAAVAAQVPELLPLLIEAARSRGWTVGRTVAIRHCRVGVLNDLGAALEAEVVVLLIGERPGLGSADSLSAYMAFRPRPGHTDANRNLVSNIHARGVAIPEAAARIMALAEAMRAAGTSGVAVKESLLSAADNRIADSPIADAGKRVS
ncbi:MAG TPA: ethanolamine ammonia-lyase subunit EutC, partial [Pirellulales bacterium]